jgi:hypothetical protein
MKRISVGLLELEMAVLECFLEKIPLSPLGVKTACSNVVWAWFTPSFYIWANNIKKCCFNYGPNNTLKYPYSKRKHKFCNVPVVRILNKIS